MFFPFFPTKGSTTLPIDETDLAACLKVFEWLAEKVAFRLERQQLAGTVIMIQMRTADWQNLSRSKTVMNPLRKGEDIYREAKKLFEIHWDGEPIRLLGITISNVIPVEQLFEQLSIDNFEKHAKDEKIDGLISTLNKELGTDMIKRGNRLD